MQKRPVIVYLDSQDYSKLADTAIHEREPDLPHLLRELKDLKDSGKVIFAFSAISVAESFPNQPSSHRHSVERIKLLNDLCDGNALINYKKIAEREIKGLNNQEAKRFSAFETSSSWLPDNLENCFSNGQADLSASQQAIATLARHGTTARREPLKYAKLTAAVRKIQRQQQQEKIDAGVFFYVKPLFHRSLLKAASGDATEAERAEIILGSWSDPEWVISLYDKVPELANWLRNGVRSSNVSAADAMEKFISYVKESDLSDQWKNGGWNKEASHQIVSLIQYIADALEIQIEEFCEDDVAEYCPGLFVEKKSTMNLVWSYIAGGNKTAIKPNSPADAMHAIYSPYVDIFRADRAMAPHIEHALSKTSAETVVVADRHKLIQEIKAKI